MYFSAVLTVLHAVCPAANAFEITRDATPQ